MTPRERLYDAADKCTANHGRNTMICVICALGVVEAIERDARSQTSPGTDITALKCPDCGGPSPGLCSTCSCELERDAERGCPLAAKNEELSAKLDREREYSANLLRQVKRHGAWEEKLLIAHQAFNVVYNCTGAPEQWERGKRLLVELRKEWDEAKVPTIPQVGVSLDSHSKEKP